MKFKYLAIGMIMTSVTLAACDININMGDGGDSKDSNKQSQNNDKNNDKTNNNDTKDNSSSNNNNASSNNNSNDESTTSSEHYAKVWVSVIEDNGGSTDVSNTEIMHKDVSGEVLNPYNESSSSTFPNGTQALYGSPTAAGQVVYKDNNDGTIDVYNVPSHFQDKRWDEDEYSKNESARILNNPKTVTLKDLSKSEIANWTSVISEYTDSSESTDNDDSNDTEVTRDNIIDKVEDYEGHTLNTSQYTYKEPEQDDNGDWGFSFEDKDGNLAGSYIVDSDGAVTKYDEDGEPE